MEWLAGHHAVFHAVNAGRRAIEKVYLSTNLQKQDLESFLLLLKEKKIRYEMKDPGFFQKNSPIQTDQGFLAQVSGFPYSSLEEIVQRKKTGLFSNLLILDEVQDPQHLGALIRSAACFGFQGVIISESHASQVGPAAAKAASGAIEYIPLARVSSIAKAIDFLKENSFWSFGAAAEAQKSIYNQDVKSNVALVIGSEGKGLRRLVREKCDFLVSIPISGPISSLSASAAGTVLMADIARQQNS